MGRYLRDNECRVSLAGNGREMDEAMVSNRIDLVVLDVMLPGEDGLALCRRLRGRSDIPVLILTARGEEVDRILAREIVTAQGGTLTLLDRVPRGLAVRIELPAVSPRATANVRGAAA